VTCRSGRGRATSFCTPRAGASAGARDCPGAVPGTGQGQAGRAGGPRINPEIKAVLIRAAAQHPLPPRRVPRLKSQNPTIRCGAVSTSFPVSENDQRTLECPQLRRIVSALFWLQKAKKKTTTACYSDRNRVLRGFFPSFILNRGNSIPLCFQRRKQSADRVLRPVPPSWQRQ